MNHKDHRNLLIWLVAMLVVYLLTACSEPEHIVPLCENIETTWDGEELKLVVHSASQSITICRDFETRTQCTTIQRHYFNCISISADYGEVIRVIDKGECHIVVR